MPKTLLLVENDPTTVKVWTSRFKDQFEVVAAFHAPEAKDYLEQKRIDLVVLDLRLNGPVPNGLEIYEFIRHNLKKKTPITFITGLAENTTLYDQAKQYTDLDTSQGLYTRLLQKPVKLKDLVEVINSMERFSEAV